MGISKELSETLESFSKAFNQAMENEEQEQEKFWNSLSDEDRLKAFCSVVRRLHQAELIENQSYRGTLYDTFEFGLEAYASAQCAGFLELHNAIYDKTAIIELLRTFNQQLMLGASEESILQFVVKGRF